MIRKLQIRYLLVVATWVVGCFASVAAVHAGPANTCVFTLSMTSGTDINNLDLSLDYSLTGGNVEGTLTHPDCARALGGNTYVSYYDNDAAQVLSVAIIRLRSFSAPVPLAGCRISYDTNPPLPGQFLVQVTNAGRDGEDGNVHPLPTVVVSAVECPGELPIPTTTTLPETTTTTLPTSCGDGAIDDGEQCDDGNALNTDGCLNGCKLAVCGDGVVRTGIEQCDDGNAVNTDACLNNCNTAVCGDGVVRASAEQCDDGNAVNTDACTSVCQSAKCGDGYIRTGVEQCDDSNALNSDSCTAACKTAICGDGFVRTGVEQCDDGNTVGTDGCVSTCQTAKCGDGFVRADVEQCDDGSLTTTGACIPGCLAASCGDGYIWAGHEECDDSNTSKHDGCDQCDIRRLCGDATGDRKLLANDALRTLQRAIGLDVDCPDWVCDINSNGVVSASDALSLLRASVGLVVNLQCGEPTALVLRLNSTFVLASLQVDIHYRNAAGDLPGDGASVECEGLLPAVNLAVNDKPTRVLSVSFLALGGFSGPRSILRCNFVPTGNVDTSDFGITVLDATNPAGGAVLGVGALAIPY